MKEAPVVAGFPLEKSLVTEDSICAVLHSGSFVVNGRCKNSGRPMMDSVNVEYAYSLGKEKAVWVVGLLVDVTVSSITDAVEGFLVSSPWYEDKRVFLKRPIITLP